MLPSIRKDGKNQSDNHELIERKPWRTPKLIVSAMSRAELSVGALCDGSVTNNAYHFPS